MRADYPCVVPLGAVASRLKTADLSQRVREDGRLLKRHIYLIISDLTPQPAVGERLARSGIRLRYVRPHGSV